VTLIKSISGIRGTIGGTPGDSLTPIDVVKFSAAYGQWMKSKARANKVVIGRDARPSGKMVSKLVANTLIGLGIDVVDIGLSTTPTVEMAVQMVQAGGGIIITASHNPIQWNALKLLNHKGEFISADDGQEILKIANDERHNFSTVEEIGNYEIASGFIEKHIEEILIHKLINTEAIRKVGFRIAIDCVNSTGGIAVPKLLKALGVNHVVELNCEPNGLFTHNPEPLPENLTEISALLADGGLDLGIAVDPDVDRLALICEDGTPFGEEYTLVAVSDYVLGKIPGNTVSNLSSTRALREITENHGGTYFASAVGEVNVVEKMKEVNAVIGGEGNGGVIYPELHYGRDALMGIALFLSHLAYSGMKISELRATYPEYYISKNKIALGPKLDIDLILSEMKILFADQKTNTIDGLKIDFEKSNEWIHLRQSNTEPIIRIYSESKSKESAQQLSKTAIEKINEIVATKV